MTARRRSVVLLSHAASTPRRPPPPSPTTPSRRANRIQERKKRIEERLAAARAAARGETDNRGEPEEEPGLGAARLAEALKTMAAKKAETDREVDEPRDRAMDRERSRRAAEETRRAELLDLLSRGAAQARAQNEAVDSKWAALFELESPQDLARALQEQTAACDAIVAAKDALAAELAKEHRSKDDAYLAALRLHAAEVDEQLDAMARQLDVLERTATKEARDVLKAHEEEQAEMMERHDAEVHAALDARRAAEADFQREALATADARADALDQLRVDQAEEFNAMKARLSRDVLHLERHMQAMASEHASVDPSGCPSTPSNPSVPSIPSTPTVPSVSSVHFSPGIHLPTQPRQTRVQPQGPRRTQRRKRPHA